MITQYVQSLAHFLQANPHWGGLITFIVSFAESLVIVGTIIPGSVTMTAIGILVGTSILPLGMTLFLATLGAFLGDIVGYWFGRHYNERLRNRWPFKTRPQWLEIGENFFHRHGGKSILIGRFVGPLRSLIPMIAGLLQMSWQKFILTALPSAALWALAYMLPGILLGALSSQLPPYLATKLIFSLFLIVVILSIFAWMMKYYFLKGKKYFSHVMEKMWHHLQNNPRLHWISRLIVNKNDPTSYHQLNLMIWTIILTSLFLFIFFSVYRQMSLILLNKPVFEFLRSIRHHHLDQFFVGITLLGEGEVLFLSGMLIFSWLIWKRYAREAFYWLGALGIGAIVPNLLKYMLYTPRPSGLLVPFTSSSFPSGHIFFSILYYGFLATLISTHRRELKPYPHLVAFILIALIGFSRLYLGAHWLSDALASFCLGYACLASLTLLYRRQINTFQSKSFLIVALLITLCTWGAYFVYSYPKNLLRYSLLWPSKTISQKEWWGGIHPTLSIYRQNRLGQPVEPMNIQYAGDIQQISHLLHTQGWKTNSDITLLKNTLGKLSPEKNYYNTLLPSLHLNNPPVLYMIKNSAQSKLILKLWDSNVYLAPYWEPLYVGNLAEYTVNPHKGKIICDFNTTEKFRTLIQKPSWQTTMVTAKVRARKLLQIKWQGKILQILSPVF